ncbi:MAG: MBL fold metallo-hydrolase [Gammaproteobacteria bacterium]|nr:MBL fold metallo-hydrolase [Gammaproteobacteria bacterium]
MPLPFMLSHINLWLLEEPRCWTLVDTGVHYPVAEEVWEKTFSGVMNNKPAGRVIVTHLHPDHVGCAGWLTRRFDVELWMSRAEYLLARVLVADTGKPAPEAGVRFYRAAGFSQESIDNYKKLFGMFGKGVSEIPESYRRLYDGDCFDVGGSTWEVIEGRGHSPEHACLLNAEKNLLISGDQLLPTISSNVSVHPTEPAANPLRDWIESLQRLQERVPGDVLVLPAHGRPFFGAHQRAAALIDEHNEGLDALLELCREPKRAVDVFGALFRSEVTERILIMATGEAIAHLNYLLAENCLSVTTDDDGVNWYQRSA